MTMRLRAEKAIYAFVTILSLVALLGCPKSANAQVPVTLNPYSRQQFFDSNGNPLAGGCLFTYSAGTSTPLATYIDNTGLFQNSNPVVLDSAGFANVWLTASAYKFVLFSAGGVNCASGSQQWTLDFVSPPPFLVGNNTWTGANTFNGVATFNAAVALAGGGSMNGAFSGSPNFTGTPIFSGTPVFNAGLTVTGNVFTDMISGINTSAGTLTVTGVTGIGANGENISIFSGAGPVGFSSGSMVVQSGNGGSGTGNIGIATGNVTGANGNSGSVNITTGAPGGIGSAGGIGITAGTGVSGTGGSVSITAGNAGANAAGNVTITGGTSGGAGAGGNVTITAGGSGGGTPGSITLSPGNGKNTVLNGGVNNNSGGFKHIRAALAGGCPTAAVAGATCTSANINWTTAFTDNSYTLACTLESVVNVPAIVVATKLAAGAGFTVTIGALSAAAANGSADCVAVHD